VEHDYPTTAPPPLETEREAAATVQHILDSPSGAGAWTDGNHRLIEDACLAAGVQLGAFDHKILYCIAGWEPTTCAVIASLIRRAGAASLTPRPTAS
jgi:hypothetical protein